MKKLLTIFSLLVPLLFQGCAQPEVSHRFSQVDPNDPWIRHKHFTIMVPQMNTWETWEILGYYSNNISVYSGITHKNRSVWIDYGLQVIPRNAENYKVRLGLFDKERIHGFHETALKTVEAMQKQDQEYLKKYASTEGFVSAHYTTVNHYPAIEVETHKKSGKFGQYDDYKKTYYIYTYSKTGKLKQYMISISASFDKPYSDDPQLSVNYSFEDMLRRAQRSLDSFTPSDEDFAEGEVSG